MGTTSVRRNLFHHLSRRPVTAAPPNAPAQPSTSNGMLSQKLPSSSSDSNCSLRSGPVDGGEIVVRDKNGGFKLDTPVLPPVIGDDGEEMDGIERGPGSAGATGADSTAQTEISVREKEKIEAGLVELIYQNRNRQMSNEPAEILDLINQSLRNKIAALEEDNWMYEPEPDSRI